MLLIDQGKHLWLHIHHLGFIDFMSNGKELIFIQELPGLKPDWLEEINSYLMKNSNKLL